MRVMTNDFIKITLRPILTIIQVVINLSLRGGRFGPEGPQPFPTEVDIQVVHDAHTEVQRCERHGQNRPMRSGSTDVKKLVLQKTWGAC